jgi:hypothetical protein
MARFFERDIVMIEKHNKFIQEQDLSFDFIWFQVQSFAFIPIYFLLAFLSCKYFDYVIFLMHL